MPDRFPECVNPASGSLQLHFGLVQNALTRQSEKVVRSAAAGPEERLAIPTVIIASIVKTQGRFLGIGQLMTVPLFFASNAIFPVSVMLT